MTRCPGQQPLLPHRERSGSSTLTEWNHRSYERNRRMDGMDGMDDNEAVPATCSRTAREAVHQRRQNGTTDLTSATEEWTEWTATKPYRPPAPAQREKRFRPRGLAAEILNSKKGLKPLRVGHWRADRFQFLLRFPCRQQQRDRGVKQHGHHHPEQFSFGQFLHQVHRHQHAGHPAQG